MSKAENGNWNKKVEKKSLLDTIYRKYENYYLKVLLKHPDDSDEEKISEFVLHDLQVPS